MKGPSVDLKRDRGRHGGTWARGWGLKTPPCTGPLPYSCPLDSVTRPLLPRKGLVLNYLSLTGGKKRGNEESTEDGPSPVLEKCEFRQVNMTSPRGLSRYSPYGLEPKRWPLHGLPPHLVRIYPETEWPRYGMVFGTYPSACNFPLPR